MSDATGAKPSEPRYYRRALLFTLAAAAIAVAAFFYRLTNADEALFPFWNAMIAFLLVAPALHIASIVSSIFGLRRGDGRLAGFATLVLNVVFVVLNFLLGGIALIGASA